MADYLPFSSSVCYSGARGPAMYLLKAFRLFLLFMAFVPLAEAQSGSNAFTLAASLPVTTDIERSDGLQLLDSMVCNLPTCYVTYSGGMQVINTAAMQIASTIKFSNQVDAPPFSIAISPGGLLCTTEIARSGPGFVTVTDPSTATSTVTSVRL